jgi:hypothetical protein
MKPNTPDDVEERAHRALSEEGGERSLRHLAPPPPKPIIGGTHELASLVADAWPKAQAFWSRFLLLGAPVDSHESQSVAQIDLGTRQVALDLKTINEKGLADCLEAILAHEVGHHVRYPGTLAVHARMRMLEKSLLPLKDDTLTNLFTDLMINDALRPRFEDQLCRVYQSFTSEYNWRADPAFIFYLAVYEERWGRAPGSLMGAKCEEQFARAYPSYRAEAQVLGQDLFHLGPNIYTQFLYFVSVTSRYVLPKGKKEPVAADPYSCGCGEPSPDDWADALTPDAREREAIRRARDEGWISKENADRMSDDQATDRRIATMPGTSDDDATRVPEVMAAYYRQQAERYILHPPPQLRTGEATTPSAIEEWEPGDALRDIDWNATLLQRGELLGAAMPLKRQKVAEAEGWEVPLWQPRIEIYLDVSGSMPDPRVTRNAMTLAAQVLVTGAIRAGGWARATLYSSAPVQYREWCRSEAELSKFLMHYIGAGTEFPFDLLRDSVGSCAGDQPIRVVITDRDFDANYKSRPANANIFADAVIQSPHFVLMLHAGDPSWTETYRRTGAQVIAVKELNDYPAMAAALSKALFARENRVAH